MEEKKLSYSVHVHGDLEKAISCPMGVYYVDLKNRLYFFEAAEGLDEKPAAIASLIVGAIAAHHDVKTAKVVMALHENFERVKKEHVSKQDDKYHYDFYVQGDMYAYVSEDTLGILYGDEEKEVYYFEAKHQGFMAPILKKKFFEGIAEDLKSEDSERRSAAIAIGEIHDNWVELDDEDVIH